MTRSMTHIVLRSVVAVLVFAAIPAEARSGSDTGPRGISGAVEVSPVDRLGPTLPPDNLLTPDSGWNGRSGSSGVAGPNYTTMTPLFAPPPPPKHRGYIILNK